MQPNLMSEPIALQPYLSVAELERRYRQAKSPAERTQFQIIWLVAQGKSTQEVASLIGYNPIWVDQLICRYNQVGSEQFIDQKNNKSGLLVNRLVAQFNTFSATQLEFGQESFFSVELGINSAYLTRF